MVSVIFYGKYSNKIQVNEKKEYYPNKHSWSTLKRPKKKLSTLLANSEGFY